MTLLEDLSAINRTIVYQVGDTKDDHQQRGMFLQLSLFLVQKTKEGAAN